MLKRTILLVLILLLVFVFISFFKIVHATWTGEGIYIRADGSVDPSDAPLATSDEINFKGTKTIR